MKEELKQREESDFCFYVLTPKMNGFFSVAEVVDDSNKRPAKTVFCFINKDDEFNCNFRGRQPAKNKGMIEMYFVEGVKS